MSQNKEVVVSYEYNSIHPISGESVFIGKIYIALSTSEDGDLAYRIVKFEVDNPLHHDVNELFNIIAEMMDEFEENSELIVESIAKEVNFNLEKQPIPKYLH